MIVAPGTTSLILDVQIVDDTGLPVTGLVAASFPAVSYSIGANAAATSVTLSDLSLITSAYNSGGVKERSGGWYRFDAPNGAFSSAGRAIFIGEASGKRLLCPEIDVQTVAADAKAIGGITQTGLDFGANWTAARAAHLDADISSRMATFTAPIAYASGVDSATVSTVVATSLKTANGFPTGTIQPGSVVQVLSGTGAGQSRSINGHNGNGTLTISPNWATTLDATSVIVVSAAGTYAAVVGDKTSYSLASSQFFNNNGTWSGTVPDSAGTTTLLTRLSSARAGYLDNLNVGGSVASHADITAINQSASRHLSLATVGQYVPSEAYTIECRTYQASDGAAVNADSTPTITVTGATSGSLSANLGAVSNPATGVYRTTYTVPSSPTLEQIRVDVSATIASATFTMSAYTQTVDEATVVWTATDQSHLTSIYNKLPTNNMADETVVLAAVGTPMQAGSHVQLATSQDQYAPAKAGDAMGVTTAGLAAFFTGASGKHYSDAVDESVVKEIASHAAGSGGGDLNGLPCIQAIAWVDATHVKLIFSAPVSLNSFSADSNFVIEGVPPDGASQSTENMIILSFGDGVSVGSLAQMTAQPAWLATTARLYTGTVRSLVDATAALNLAGAVNGIWDVSLAGHLGAGSTGAKLNAAGAAGDPLANAVPGIYAPGTAGYALGTELQSIDGKLNGASITTSSPVDVDGFTTIVQGDDYGDGSANPSLTYTITAYGGPSVSGATVKWLIVPLDRYEKRGASTPELTVTTGATVTANGGTLTIKVPLTATQSNFQYTSPPDASPNYKIVVQVIKAGAVMTQAILDAVVLKRIG